MKPRANHARLHRAVDSGAQKYIAATVVSAHLIAIRDSTSPGIDAIHFEQADFLHLLNRRQI